MLKVKRLVYAFFAWLGLFGAGWVIAGAVGALATTTLGTWVAIALTEGGK